MNSISEEYRVRQRAVEYAIKHKDSRLRDEITNKKRQCSH